MKQCYVPAVAPACGHRRIGDSIQACAFWNQSEFTGGKTKVKEDRRALPRVEADLSAQVILPNGEQVAVRVRDISRSGVSFATDRNAAERIVPKELREARTAAEFSIQLSLELLEGPPREINARCLLVHASHRTGGDYFFGFRYLSFEGDGYQVVEQFITDSMRWD